MNQIAWSAPAILTILLWVLVAVVILVRFVVG